MLSKIFRVLNFKLLIVKLCFPRGVGTVWITRGEGDSIVENTVGLFDSLGSRILLGKDILWGSSKIFI